MNETDLQEIIEKFDSDKEFRVSQAFDDCGIDSLRARLHRAAFDQLCDDKSMASRYGIWANTVRDNIRQADSEIEKGNIREAHRLLCRSANSLSAFAELQGKFDLMRIEENTAKRVAKPEMQTMRQQAAKWIKTHHPLKATNLLRSSRFYPEKEIWFFTFPSTFFGAGMEGYLNILCETETDSNDFHYLKVPFSFFRENRDKFNIRATGESFDLHISGKRKNWLLDERSDNLSFAVFEQ
jgi:hypothetical protein